MMEKTTTSRVAKVAWSSKPPSCNLFDSCDQLLLYLGYFQMWGLQVPGFSVMPRLTRELWNVGSKLGKDWLGK